MISPAGLSLPAGEEKTVSWADSNKGLENGAARTKR